MRLITIMGEPVTQGRPRFSTKDGYVRAYDPVKSRVYKDFIRLHVRGMKFNLEANYQVNIRVFRGVPKSWSKKKKQAAKDGTVLPSSRPDVDNYAKSVMDALTGVVWKDDSQIIKLSISKLYGEPRLEIEICEIGA